MFTICICQTLQVGQRVLWVEFSDVSQDGKAARLWDWRFGHGSVHQAAAKNREVDGGLRLAFGG